MNFLIQSCGVESAKPIYLLFDTQLKTALQMEIFGLFFFLLPSCELDIYKQANFCFNLQITCGLDHTLLLCHDGRVVSCGWGADGQTGRSVASTHPKLFLSLCKIVSTLCNLENGRPEVEKVLKLVPGSLPPTQTCTWYYSVHG